MKDATIKIDSTERHPAHRNFPRWDSRDDLMVKFLSVSDNRINTFNTPYIRIKDVWHKDFLEYLWYQIEVKDNKIWLSLIHLHIIILYRNLWDFFWEKSKKLLQFAYLFKDRLNYYRNIHKTPIPQFEFFLWLSLQWETNLYLYKDNLDFDTVIQLNTNRFLWQYNDEPHTIISLTNQWEIITKKKQKVYRPTFYLLSKAEEELILSINENINNSWTTIKANIKKDTLESIEISRNATQEELENIHKTGQNLYFWEIKDLKYVHWKAVSAIITDKIRFDKTKYIRIR